MANINPSAVRSFMDLHKRRRAPWLLVSALMFVGFLAVVAYAYKSGNEYSPLVARRTSTPGLEETEAIVKVSASEQKTPESILASTLYFKKNQSIYKRSPLSSSPEVVSLAKTYAVSQDNSMIALYTAVDNSESGEIVLIDIKNQNKQNLKLKNYDDIREIIFSPDAKYLLVNSGTGALGTTKVVDIATAQETSEFGQMGGIHWADEYHFFKTKLERGIFARPWGSGEGSSVEMIDIRNMQGTTMLKATDLVDYAPLEIYKSCLLVKKSHVASTAQWAAIESQSIFSETICLDMVTKVEVDNNYESEMVDDNATLSNIFSYMKLDKSAGDNIIWDLADKKGDWIMFEVQHAESDTRSDIYLTNTKDPQNSLMLMGQGEDLSWR